MQGLYFVYFHNMCCGLEVHYPTKELKSVKDPGNTFNINSKWAGTLPSLIYFSWDIYGLKLKVLPGPLTDLNA
jgi:hypothetical protein